MPLYSVIIYTCLAAKAMEFILKSKKINITPNLQNLEQLNI